MDPILNTAAVRDVLGQSVNLNIVWSLKDIEELLILLGVTMVQWVCRNVIY